MFKSQYRGRFAPSPTGALHAGSLATALNSWLHAKAHDGKWLLRIEDIDGPRCVPGADQTIIQQLTACGLVWDEEIVYQSKRTQLYQTALNQLIRNGQAYACRCTRKQIEDALTFLGKKKDRHGELIYPGTCRDLNHIQEPCAWRLRVTDPNIEASVGDFVLRRSDQIFTYQMAVVVDDHLQGITHVVRGGDLLDNTPRQLHLQEQLSYSHPSYVHVPLVLDEHQEKLSKQTKALALDVSDTDKALQALKNAAKHIGLTQPELFKTDRFKHELDSSFIQLWLTIATDNYRELLEKKALHYVA